MDLGLLFAFAAGCVAGVIILKLVRLWRKPPARQRVLSVLSATDGKSGAQICNEAEIWTANLYPLLFKMENEGTIVSDWEAGPPKEWAGGARRRLYKLKSPRRAEQ